MKRGSQWAQPRTSRSHSHPRWRRGTGAADGQDGAQLRRCAVGDVHGWDLPSAAHVHVVVVVAVILQWVLFIVCTAHQR